MSSDIEAQAEERESLHAIYDTDCEYDYDACSYKVGMHCCCCCCRYRYPPTQVTSLHLAHRPY